MGFFKKKSRGDSVLRQVHCISGHSETAWSVRYSPDGEQVASAGSDDTVRLWSTQDGSQQRSFEITRPRSLAYSPDGTRMACGTGGNGVTVFDLPAGTRKDFRESRDVWGAEMYSVAFSPDGRQLLAGGLDPWIRLFEVPSGREIRKFAPTSMGQVYAVHTVIFSPKGDTAYSCGPDSDRWVRVWKLETGEPLRPFKDVGPYACCTLWPDGSRMLTGNEHGEVRVWDVPTRRCLGTMEEIGNTSNSITSLAISPDGQWILSNDSCSAGHVTLRRALGGKIIGQALPWQAGADPDGLKATRVDISACGRFGVTCHKDGKIRIWRLPRE